MAMQQDPIDWRYRFHIFKAYVSGNIPTKYGLIWYQCTSILGSWRSPIDQWVAGRTSHTMGQNRGIHMLGITHGQLGTFRPHKKKR